MNPTASLSIWHLIASAGPVVKLVLFLLLCASVWSWTVIFQRIMALKQANKALHDFQKTFWSGVEMAKLYKEMAITEQCNLGIGHIFCAGFKDFLRIQQSTSIGVDAVMDATQRAMRVAMARETDRIENGLPILATIGSVSPYVGLFGTVWGIMQSFTALAGVEQATLSMVAPGISEALIATAMGLFVAIPAVIAYNRFNAHTEKLLNEYDNFQEEFAGILHRQLYRREGAHG